jgi:uncharacterized protein YbaA (DUF1428 family)
MYRRAAAAVQDRVDFRDPHSSIQDSTDASAMQQELAMTYVDGFVAAVPSANREKYREFAHGVAAVFREHGALKVVDCWGNDVPEGKVTSFPIFSWVTWPSREVRDAAMKKINADPRMQSTAKSMPFDGARLIFGGFETIVEQ